MMSRPDPPNSRSLPRPPNRRSDPPDPTSTSLPGPPNSLSSPLVPTSRSRPAVPMMRRPPPASGRHTTPADVPSGQGTDPIADGVRVVGVVSVGVVVVGGGGVGVGGGGGGGGGGAAATVTTADAASSSGSVSVALDAAVAVSVGVPAASKRTAIVRIVHDPLVSAPIVQLAPDAVATQPASEPPASNDVPAGSATSTRASVASPGPAFDTVRS